MKIIIARENPFCGHMSQVCVCVQLDNECFEVAIAVEIIGAMTIIIALENLFCGHVRGSVVSRLNNQRREQGQL